MNVTSVPLFQCAVFNMKDRLEYSKRRLPKENRAGRLPSSPPVTFASYPQWFSVWNTTVVE